MATKAVTAMISCYIAHTLISGRVAHHAFIRGNRSSFLPSLMALIAITVVTMQGTVCCANRASHCMTVQTKRFIYHSPGFVLNRHGSGGGYIRAVSTVAGKTVTAMVCC
jgi:hypothetical protein